jgi:hypothetical protein
MCWTDFARVTETFNFTIGWIRWLRSNGAERVDQPTNTCSGSHISSNRLYLLKIFVNKLSISRYRLKHGQSRRYWCIGDIKASSRDRSAVPSFFLRITRRLNAYANLHQMQQYSYYRHRIVYYSLGGARIRRLKGFYDVIRTACSIGVFFASLSTTA